MRTALAFGVGGARPASALARHGSVLPRRRGDETAGTCDDVGLEALGQVLAEPRGFPRRDVGAREASNASTRGVPHVGATQMWPERVGRQVRGVVEAALVALMLVAGSVLVLAPIAIAAKHAISAYGATPLEAHVDEAAAASRHPVVEARILKLAPARAASD
jgi:hypothetical protein